MLALFTQYSFFAAVVQVTKCNCIYERTQAFSLLTSLFV